MQSPDFPELAYVPALGDGSIDSGARRQLTQMAVIHATDNTASDENEAAYASHRSDQTSAHIYADGDSCTQSVRLDNIAYGCYSIGNSRSVQFELTGLSNHVVDAVMRQAAPYVARVCARYAIPIRKISAADLRSGVKGICGHGDVTAAWGQGDHTDPGSAFPWDTFIAYVQAAAVNNPPIFVPIGNPGAAGGLVVDGQMGPHTVTALQKRFGTTQDGFITQPPGRSSMVSAMQSYFNSKGIRDKNGNLLSVDGVGLIQDGHTHYHTIEALQRHLGVTMDGVLDSPISGTVKRLQESLNAGTF